MIRLEVPGPPIAKGRPRFTRQARAYTPDKTIKAENAVAKEAAEHFTEALRGPLKLEILAIFAPPKSWPKRKTAENMGLAHTQRPDADNVAKLVCDALNGIAWADDAQVFSLRVVKVWGPDARTIITIMEAGE